MIVVRQGKAHLPAYREELSDEHLHPLVNIGKYVIGYDNVIAGIRNKLIPIALNPEILAEFRAEGVKNAMRVMRHDVEQMIVVAAYRSLVMEQKPPPTSNTAWRGVDVWSRSA